MKSLQKMGGVAALLEAATFIFGFALYVTLLESADYGSLDIDPVENVKFLAENEALMYLWNFVIYVLFGLLLVVLALALHERVKESNAALVQVGTAFALVWAGLVIASGMVANIGAGVVVGLYEDDPERAGTTWLALHFVVDGLGGGNEVVGGAWVLLISLAARAAREFPAPLVYLGLVAGAAGLVSAVPFLGEAMGAVFGLGLIAWFTWIGIVMLRESPNDAAPRTASL